MMGLLFAALQLIITLVALACVKSTRADRTYHPMVLIVWIGFAFVYGGSFVGSLTNHTGAPNPVTRLVFNIVTLLVVCYALWFMRRRNRTARFLGLTLGGDLVVRSVEELEAAALLTESWVHHGAMPEERVAKLREALAGWDEKQAWKVGLQEQVRERRQRRGGTD